MVVLASSCATQKRFDRMVSKHPEFLEKYIDSRDTTVVRDTIIERDTTVRIDTTYIEYRDSSSDHEIRDTFEVDTFWHITEKVTVRVTLWKDRLNIWTHVEPDTIYQVDTIYRDKTTITEETTITEKVAVWKAWVGWIKRHLWLTALYAALLISVFFLIRKYWKIIVP